ncbi:MAG TPA: pseudouridine-5'-phosphate glycosidase [Candidatus Limnocylindrales bacterium]|nr:pseudouridine-5'-phosphate glycosidase [Candidatus Limnocylindrales bacterium]
MTSRPAMTSDSALAAAGLVDRLAIHPEVAAALRAGRPVVALESTLISHGLPYPANLQVAQDSEAAIREGGAVPATVAVRDGRLLVGVDEADLAKFARLPAGSVVKASRPSLAAALARRGWAGTTVSTTMLAAHAAGIRVFATGGIGGVHRGARFDVSSDLDELARTPVAVVCAGPKSILDVAATIEVLETRGVPVVSLAWPEVAGFTARGSGVAAPIVAADAADLARIVSTHLGLGLGSGVLVTVPLPAEDALPDAVARQSIERAVADADAAGVHGPALTPWLLTRIAELTDGASVRANTALIVNNARVGARLARDLLERA